MTLFHLLCVVFLQALLIFLILLANSLLERGPFRSWDLLSEWTNALNQLSVPINIRSSIYSHSSPFPDINVGFHYLLNVMPSKCSCIVNLQILGRDLFLLRFSGLVKARNSNTVYRVPLNNIVHEKLQPQHLLCPVCFFVMFLLTMFFLR